MSSADRQNESLLTGRPDITLYNDARERRIQDDTLRRKQEIEGPSRPSRTNKSPSPNQHGDSDGKKSRFYQKRGQQLAEGVRGVRKLISGEGAPGPQDRQTSRPEDHPQGSHTEHTPQYGSTEDPQDDTADDHPQDANTKDRRLSLIAGEESVQLRSGFPIPGSQEVYDGIKSRFLDLYMDLKTWSTSFVTDQEIEEPSSNAMEVIKAFMPAAKNGGCVERLVSDRGSRRLLVEALASFVIFSRTFEGFSEESIDFPLLVDVWISEEARKSIQDLEKVFRKTDGGWRPISPSDFNGWRALSMTLVAQISTTTSEMKLVERQAGELSEYIMNLLKGWYPAGQSSRNCRKLATLIKDYIELSKLLRQQRAYWFVSYKNGQNEDCLDRFDARIMTDVDADDSEEDKLAADAGQEHGFLTQPKEVLFKISPGLFKKGNADGLGYDIEECYVGIKVKTSSARGEGLAVSCDYSVRERMRPRYGDNPIPVRPVSEPAYLRMAQGNIAPAAFR